MLGLSLAALLLVAFLQSRRWRDDLPLTLSHVMTNNHGVREYEFTLKNRAWDCLLNANVRMCAEPEKARARAKYHQGARIWPSMQTVYSITNLSGSSGATLLRGKSAVFRFPEPANSPWMLDVYCVRTNTSRLLMALAEVNQAANARFGVPVLVTVEAAAGRISPLMEPPP